MKLNKIQALVLTLGLALSSGAMFAGKTYAAPNDTATADFSGTVNPSCTVTTDFNNGTEYASTGTGTSLGDSGIAATSTVAVFDCNSDSLNIEVQETTGAPAAGNATALVGQHAFTYTVNDNDANLPDANYPSNENGDANIAVTSTWVGGEDLLAGDYSASVVVTVTAN